MNENRALTIPAGSKLAPIMPTSFEDVQRFARVAVAAGMFKADGEETALAQATLAVMQGLESGIPPMQAIQQIAIINGRATIWGDLVPALIWSRGHEIEEWIEGEGDGRVAHCQITRGDNGRIVKRSFSVKQAVKAGLWDTRARVKRWNNQKKEWYEKDNDNPWFRFDERMLQMRARGFCARDAVPDVLRGMYIREEMEEERPVRDITPERASVQPAPPSPPAPPPPPAIEASQELPAFDLGAFKQHLESELAVAQDQEALGETWAHHEITMDDNCSRDEREELLDLYKAHEARIAGTGAKPSTEAGAGA